jgi:hypothetical protein
MPHRRVPEVPRSCPAVGVREVSVRRAGAKLGGGTRAAVSVANLFDARPSVRDGISATPVSYQRAYLDPLGRLASLSLRKIL